MHLLRLAAMILAIMGGYLGLSSGSASATPLGAGALPSASEAAKSPLVQNAQYYRRRHYRPYRVYRPYRAYRPYRPIYRPFYRPRPRRVCFIRYTPWGPRRVCRWR